MQVRGRPVIDTGERMFQWGEQDVTILRARISAAPVQMVRIEVTDEETVGEGQKENKAS